MITKLEKLKDYQNPLILGIIWLLGMVGDRYWFFLDHSIPSWDQADYLNGVMSYWQAFQSPEWLNSDWWRSFWLISSKIPPLIYILTTPFFQLLQPSVDHATLILSVCSAVLLISIYQLGKQLFNPTIGLWAAAFCQVIPGLYYYRLEFLLDYPLTAFVTLSFWLLTRWYLTDQQKVETEKSDLEIPIFNLQFSKTEWLNVVAFGLGLGLALMVKQTTVFFLYIPLIWIFINLIIQKRWLRLGQFLAGLWVALIICWPWYRSNWLLMLTSGKRATIDSAIAEGDPSLLTIDAWIYYLKVLPYLISWVLIVIPIIALIIYFIKQGFDLEKIKAQLKNLTLTWLILFLASGYLLSSLNVNKDARYLLPLLPVLALILAVILTSINSFWKIILPWLTLTLTTLLMIYNIFSLNGEKFTQILSPLVQKYPNIEQGWPHQQVIGEIEKTTPYLSATLGVLPSTPQINQHNFSLYGGMAGFQVYGRQVGVREKEVEQDLRSLDWFLTSTGDQGSIPPAQKNIVELLENSPEFKINKSWPLPDQGDLNLYHRQQPLVEINSLDQPQNQIKLEQIIVPEKAPPGFPIPITYQWSGSTEELQSGIIILTWLKEGENNLNLPPSHTSWLHDHGFGMGRLYLNSSHPAYQVIERTAMLPDPGIALGNYHLEAQYLNRKTGEHYPIYVPPITLKISLSESILEAPELDLVTQFRTVAEGLAKGKEGLEPIFTQTARINQYDPTQDYLKQAEKSLEYRLKSNYSDDEKILWAYELTLARALQQNLKGTITALKEVIKLDSNNPYAYAYLAFCYLYDWNVKEAQKALDPALKMYPNLPEVQAMEGAIALMKGNFLKAWLIMSQLKLI